jgi:hypothetical protein
MPLPRAVRTGHPLLNVPTPHFAGGRPIQIDFENRPLFPIRFMDSAALLGSVRTRLALRTVLMQNVRLGARLLALSSGGLPNDDQPNSREDLN